MWITHKQYRNSFYKCLFFGLFNSVPLITWEAGQARPLCHCARVCTCQGAPVCSSWALSLAPTVRWNVFSLLTAFPSPSSSGGISIPAPRSAGTEYWNGKRKEERLQCVYVHNPSVRCHLCVCVRVRAQRKHFMYPGAKLWTSPLSPKRPSLSLGCVVSRCSSRMRDVAVRLTAGAAEVDQQLMRFKVSSFLISFKMKHLFYHLLT